MELIPKGLLSSTGSSVIQFLQELRVTATSAAALRSSRHIHGCAKKGLGFRGLGLYRGPSCDLCVCCFAAGFRTEHKIRTFIEQCDTTRLFRGDMLSICSVPKAMKEGECWA